MKILHTGDWHLTAGPIFETTRICLEYLVDFAAREKPHVVLIGGDLFGTRTQHIPTPEEWNLVADVILALGSIAQDLVAIVEGNHERPGQLYSLGHLGLNCEAVCEAPRGIGIGLCVPHPRRRAIRAQDADEALATFLLGAVADGAPPWALIHLPVIGAAMGGGEVQALAEPSVSPAVLEETGIPYVGLSHIHLAQQVAANAWYAGVPQHQDFGGAGPCGFNWVMIENGAARVEHVRTPARGMVTLDYSWSAGVWNVTEKRPRLAEPDAPAFGKVRLTWEEGASPDFAAIEQFVATELRHLTVLRWERRCVPQQRVRAPEVAAAAAVAGGRNLYELLAAYNRTLDKPLGDDDLDRVTEVAEQ